MSYEFLVWFEPISEGLMVLFLLTGIAALIGAIICGVSLGDGVKAANTVRRLLFLSVVVFFLSAVGAIVANAFAEGPDLYKKSQCVGACAEEQ